MASTCSKQYQALGISQGVGGLDFTKGSWLKRKPRIRKKKLEGGGDIVPGSTFSLTVSVLAGFPRQKQKYESPICQPWATGLA